MGIYHSPQQISGTQHWTSTSLNFPMTLNLYNYNNKDSIVPIFNWYPDDPQWWVNGFNPNSETTIPDKDKQVMIGSIDFSESQHKRGMYEGFEGSEDIKNIDSYDIRLKSEYIIFDEINHKAWIIWWR